MITKQYPTDEETGEPERGEGEGWYHYHRRWWFYWAKIEGDKRRITMSGQKVVTTRNRNGGA